MKRLRVLVVDDHPVVRLGLRGLLHEAPDIELVGEAADGPEAVACTRQLQPDLVLMDLALPGLDGAAATAQILAHRPRTRVLVLSGKDVDPLLFAALRAGALGYVAKSAGSRDLVRAIRQVAAGRPWMPVELTRRLLALPAASPPVEPLSPRETEILRAVARGWTNRQVAARLRLSEATVRTHVSRVLAKLGAANRVEATLFALKSGISSLTDDEADLTA
jgi:NarL family two-component system response regulator LiaR